MTNVEWLTKEDCAQLKQLLHVPGFTAYILKDFQHRVNGNCYDTRLQLEVNVVSLTEGEEPWMGTDRIFTIPCTDIAVHEVSVFWKGPKDFYSRSVRDWQNVKLGTDVDNTGRTEAL